MPFNNVRDYVDAPGYELGVFRKVPSQATTAGNWCDLSMAAGTPVPNYYASSPLVAATLEQERGIWHGGNTGPGQQKVLRNFGLMSPTANAIPGSYWLLDYLLYYPFIDLDAAGEEQVMDNTVSLPRYSTGAGVKAFMVNVAPTLGGGSFQFTYRNQDGVLKTSPVHFCSAATNIATFTATVQNASGFGPWLQLAQGDTGIRSIETVTMLQANGGLGAIVLAHPIRPILLRDIGAPREVESLRDRPTAPTIYDGAYLNVIGNTPTGSIATGTLVGFIETIWG